MGIVLGIHNHERANGCQLPKSIFLVDLVNLDVFMSFFLGKDMCRINTNGFKWE